MIGDILQWIVGGLRTYIHNSLWEICKGPEDLIYLYDEKCANYMIELIHNVYLEGLICSFYVKEEVGGLADSYLFVKDLGHFNIYIHTYVHNYIQGTYICV